MNLNMSATAKSSAIQNGIRKSHIRNAISKGEQRHTKDGAIETLFNGLIVRYEESLDFKYDYFILNIYESENENWPSLHRKEFDTSNIWLTYHAVKRCNEQNISHRNLKRWIQEELPYFEDEIEWQLKNGIRVVLVRGYNDQIIAITVVGLTKHINMKIRNKEKIML